MVPTGWKIDSLLVSFCSSTHFHNVWQAFNAYMILYTGICSTRCFVKSSSAMGDGSTEASITASLPQCLVISSSGLRSRPLALLVPELGQQFSSVGWMGAHGP